MLSPLKAEHRLEIMLACPTHRSWKPCYDRKSLTKQKKHITLNSSLQISKQPELLQYNAMMRASGVIWSHILIK